MPTLHERLAELADDAPATPTPPGIWAEGRRRARVKGVGTASVVAAAALALAALGGITLQRSQDPGYADQPGQPPALPRVLHQPSGWLPVDDEPPGQLSMLVPAKRTHLIGYTWGVVGVSATTGAYGFLDLPGYNGGEGLAPDGKHVAYSLGTGRDHDQVVHGIAVYDTLTGNVVRWRPTPGRPTSVQDVVWQGDDTLTFTYADNGKRRAFEWRFGYGAPRPLHVRLGSPAGSAGDGGLWSSGARRYRYLGGRSGPSTQFRLAWRYPTISEGLAVSASGRRVAAVHATQFHSRLLVGRPRSGDRPTPMRRVAPSLQWPTVVGWVDDRHLVVVDQVTPRGVDGEGDPGTRYALERVDVRTGRVEQVSDVGGYWGPSVDYARDLLGRPARDFPAPPRPLGPRVELASGSAIVVVAGLLLVLWRRRVRA
jgi:hypothetical protein